MNIFKKISEKDIELLKNIDIIITDRQHGCDEIYEMAENCVFNGEVFHMDTDDELS